jgi:hypothetical protein
LQKIVRETSMENSDMKKCVSQIHVKLLHPNYQSDVAS